MFRRVRRGGDVIDRRLFDRATTDRPDLWSRLRAFRARRAWRAPREKIRLGSLGADFGRDERARLAFREKAPDVFPECFEARAIEAGEAGDPIGGPGFRIELSIEPHDVEVIAAGGVN